jgi:hypothetical protein
MNYPGKRLNLDELAIRLNTAGHRAQATRVSYTLRVDTNRGSLWVYDSGDVFLSNDSLTLDVFPIIRIIEDFLVEAGLLPPR